VVSSFTVIAATPAVEVRISAGVAIGTGSRGLAGRDRHRRAVQVPPMPRIRSGSRRLNPSGRAGPLTSSAIAIARAAAVTRTQTSRRVNADPGRLACDRDRS
jgi:hypothetical protein